MSVYSRCSHMRPFTGGADVEVFVWLALMPLTGRGHQLRAHCAGLAVAADGSLLVADDVGQAVWRVSYAP